MIDDMIVNEQKTYDELLIRLRKLNSATPDLLSSQRRIEQLEFSYKKVAGEIRDLEVELKAPPRVALIQKAI